MTAFAEAREQRLRGLYVRGEIEVEEFEERIAAILRDAPEPADESIAGLAVYTDKPGSIIYYNPAATLSGILKEAWTTDPKSPEDAEPGEWEQS